MRSSAKTIGAIVGNHMLDRADALVKEMRVPARLRADARQVAVLAILEEQDPQDAVRRFSEGERSSGTTGGGTRPTVFHFTPDRCDRLAAQDGTTPRMTPQEIATAAQKLEVAGAVLVKLSKRQREMLVLTSLGWTQEEVAAHLGIRQQAVSAALVSIEQRSQALLRANTLNTSQPDYKRVKKVSQ